MEDNLPVVRNNKGQFVKGYSGNPKGLPKNTVEEALRVSREKKVYPFEILADIASNKKNANRDRINALRILAAYIYGQPRQQVDIENNSIEIIIHKNAN